MKKWADRYMKLAQVISTWSKDPSTKVGAIVVGHNGEILSQGYNGFPRKIKDTDCRLNNRSEKYKYIIHAEMNAIFNASLNGVSLQNASIYIYGLPICHECAKGIIQVGIKKVIIHKQIKDNWQESCQIAQEMLIEAGIKIIEIN